MSGDLEPCCDQGGLIQSAGQGVPASNLLAQSPGCFIILRIDLTKVILMSVWRFFASVALGLAPLAAVAQDQCAKTPDIVELATTILQDRPMTGRLEQRPIGVEAAYLLIHYGDLDRTAIAAMLADLTAGSAAGAADLSAAYQIAQTGTADGLSVIDPDPVRAFAMAGQSVRRAILLVDNGQTYFDLLARASADAAFEALLSSQTRLGLDLTALVSDQSDDALLALSQMAEADGFVSAAAVLAANMTTLATYEDIIDRNQYDPFLAENASWPWITHSGATLRHGTGPVPPMDPSAQANPSVYATLRASYFDGPEQFSATVMNQAGWNAEGETAALTYIAEVEAGRIDPVRDPESAWLFQYRVWTALKGRSDVHRVIGFFDFPSARVCHFAGTALETLDWMTAKEALRPFLLGESQVLPTRPALLSDGFDWDMWTDVATTLTTGQGDLTQADTARQNVALELLAETGRHDEMEALAEAVLDPFDRLSLLRDVMQRLDRQCDAWTASNGQALLMNGILFRF
jgi:hypothetical protein